MRRNEAILSGVFGSVLIFVFVLTLLNMWHIRDLKNNARVDDYVLDCLVDHDARIREIEDKITFESNPNIESGETCFNPKNIITIKEAKRLKTISIGKDEYIIHDGKAYVYWGDYKEYEIDMNGVKWLPSGLTGDRIIHDSEAEK